MMGKKVVVLRFQASYCKPCVKESAALSRLTERYGPRGVEVLALHVQDTAADVRRFMRAQKPGYAIALDPKLVVGNRYRRRARRTRSSSTRRARSSSGTPARAPSRACRASSTTRSHARPGRR